MSAETTRPAGDLSPSARRILHAAARLFALQGYSATSTRDIAAAVGVRQPALYKHFPSKDAILAALVDAAVGPALAAARDLESRPGRAAAHLYRWLSDYLARLEDSPYLLVSILVTPELGQDRFAAERRALDRLEQVTTDLVARGQAEGDLRPLDPRSGARMVLALFDALALPETAVAAREIADFALHGLLADPARLDDLRREAAAPLPPG
ncbi:TetR/AcrR family transcriptional regulator [Actinomadura kijaniata]|uniref:TetR/AcrR family transcriptional regulator n=1 Tax=Actinomadura kijaniata TaxID=46161 RepID=UPI0008340D2F|nr:TetR/AcrR family transcriptional regulator [Actinomadura kijaniata]